MSLKLFVGGVGGWKVLNCVRRFRISRCSVDVKLFQLQQSPEIVLNAIKSDSIFIELSYKCVKLFSVLISTINYILNL